MDFETIYIVFAVIPYCIFLIVRKINDRKSELREFLEPEVSKYDLEIVKVTHSDKNIFGCENGDFSINAAIGGPSGGMVQKIFYVPKTVILKDKNNNEHHVHASVDFRGLTFRKFERVRWKPSLETISKENKLT